MILPIHRQFGSGGTGLDPVPPAASTGEFIEDPQDHWVEPVRTAGTDALVLGVEQWVKPPKITSP